MDEFREDVDNPTFLFISDDMAWARKNIENEHGDLFFVGTGKGKDDFSIRADLAVMALSNSTIITRGTYSMWGSILCGGMYHTEYGMIVPDELMYPDDKAFQEELIL